MSLAHCVAALDLCTLFFKYLKTTTNNTDHLYVYNLCFIGKKERDWTTSTIDCKSNAADRQTDSVQQCKSCSTHEKTQTAGWVRCDRLGGCGVYTEGMRWREKQRVALSRELSEWEWEINNGARSTFSWLWNVGPHEACETFWCYRLETPSEGKHGH